MGPFLYTNEPLPARTSDASFHQVEGGFFLIPRYTLFLIHGITEHPTFIAFHPLQA